MSLTNDLTKLANSANVLVNSITVNSTAITSIAVGGASLNATTFDGTANNANYLGGTAAAGYQTTAGLSANVATLSANASTYLNGKTESNLNVNSALTSNSASYLGGNTASDLRSYSDTAAATAYSNGTSYADTKAATAYSNATSYADTKAATAYSNATSYADTKAATAYSNATSYADTKAATAYTNATSYVDGKSYVNTSQLSTNLSNYAALSGATFTGAVTVSNNFTVTGNLTLSGNTVIVGANNLVVQDAVVSLHTPANLSQLTSNDGKNIGLAFHYYDTEDRHALLYRDNSTGYLQYHTDGGDPISNSNPTGNSLGTIQTARFWAGNSSVYSTANATNYTGTANNTSFVGSVTAANVVSNAQLSGNLANYVTATNLSNNLANYQTTAGLSANVATLTANAAAFLNGKPEANLNVNNALTANSASYLGSTIASGYQTTAGLSANVATLTANNANNLGGVAAASYAQLASPTFSGNILLPASNTNTGAYCGSGSSDNFTTRGVVIPHYSLKWAIGSDNVNPGVYLSGYGGVKLFTNGTERITVDQSGNTGIGSTSPAYKLDVNGYVGSTRYNLTSTNSTYAYGDGSGWTFGGSGYVYFNQSGTTYSQTRIQARAGISNDQAADLTLYGGTSGYTTITGSARSPIFYDTDNTAYYLDPTGSTSLVAAGVIASYRNDTQEILRAYNTSAGNAAQFYIAHNYGSATVGNSRGTLDISGTYTTIAGSARSPYFYDSDNTTYYANPAGDSNFYGVIASNWFRAIGQTGLYSQTYGHHLYAQAGGQYWAVSSTGSSGGFQFRTAYETAIRGYLYWDGTDNFGLLQSGGGWILRTWNTGVESYGSHRAPIFYDSNDTGYYCDPNSYSSMYSLRLWGNEFYIRGGSPTIHFQDTDQYSAALHNNSNLFYVLRGGVDDTSWSTVGSGWWPCYWNLTNNDCVMGGNLSTAYNVIAYASDRRLKENIAEIPNALDKIKQIRGVTFDWNDDAEVLGFTPETKYNDLGVIAQEIQAVLPQAVKPAPFDQWFPDPSGDYEQEYLDQMMGTSRSGENYLTVQLEKLVPLLIEGIKEQQIQIERLENEINILKGGLK